MIKNTQNIGLKALIELFDIKEIDSTAVSFSLAPRINACGRMGKAGVTVELLLEKDIEKAKQIAITLDELNTKRQEIEKEIFENAIDMINLNGMENKKSIKNEKILTLLFWAILIFSLINMFYALEPIIYLLIILNIIYVIITFYDDIIVKNNAESERRKTLISDTFSINLTSKKTNGYYNNNFPPSVKKLGIDSFESMLYTKKNLSMMLLTEGFKTLVMFIVWFIIITKFNNKELLLNLTQTFFSLEILFKFIKLIYYYFNVSRLYDEFYQLFITKKYDEKKDQALILEYVMEYECLKTYCHILLSNKNFAKINNILSGKWESLKNDIE